jgi:hypothetical protein
MCYLVRVIGAAFVLSLPLDITVGNAADWPECFSAPLHYNVCQKAREIQSEMATSPVDVGIKVTLLKVAAFDRRLELTAVWRLTTSEINEALLTGSMTQTVLSYKANEMTRHLVCGDSRLAEFVRQKGEVEYVYIAENGRGIASVVVRECSEKR